MFDVLHRGVSTPILCKGRGPGHLRRGRVNEGCAKGRERGRGGGREGWREGGVTTVGAFVKGKC